MQVSIFHGRCTTSELHDRALWSARQSMQSSCGEDPLFHVADRRPAKVDRAVAGKHPSLTSALGKLHFEEKIHPARLAGMVIHPWGKLEAKLNFADRKLASWAKMRGTRSCLEAAPRNKPTRSCPLQLGEFRHFPRSSLRICSRRLEEFWRRPCRALLPADSTTDEHR